MNDYILSEHYELKNKVKSPLRYPGGKFYALKHILPYINCVPHEEYREPFLGGGSVFFAKDKASVNVLNDLEFQLINFYSLIQDESKKEILIKMLDKEEATRERHSQIKTLIPTNEIEEAFKTFYLNRTSYCGIINNPAWGYADGKSSPPKNWGNFINDASRKLQNVSLYSLDYSNILNLPSEGRSVLMYLDPPYYHADQKRAYTKPFETEDHVRLSNELRNTPFLFCLSYDDCSEIRDLYSWACIYDVSWLYNTDNKPGQKRKACKELIITNYKVHNEASLFD